MKLIRRVTHKVIQWYLRRCGGAFHTNPYGPSGRYIVLMNEDQYQSFASRSSPRAEAGNARTIQEAIDRGWIECRSNDACAEILKVDKDGTVEKCKWGCFEYWNLFIQLS